VPGPCDRGRIPDRVQRPYIAGEDLPDAVLGVAAPVVPAGREEVIPRSMHPEERWAIRPSLRSKLLSSFISPGRQMAHSALTGLGVLGRDVDRAAAEGQVPELDADELADTAAQLVGHPHHQLVAVILDHIEELLPFLCC
jgi:hypothetical protein